MNSSQDIFTMLKMSNDESEYLEESTHLQSQSLLWFQHRAGRITASLFRRVKQVSLTTTPASLVKTILQESKVDSSKVPALQWGLSNEDRARSEYLSIKILSVITVDYM